MDDSDVFRKAAETRFGTVGEAMTRNVVAMEPGMRASDAAAMLTEAGVAGGPVVEGGRVVGILTLRDLIEKEGHGATQTTGPFLRGERHLANLTVADVMTREVFTARQEWPLTRALALMDDAGVNRLPVLDREDRPVGILARDDVLRAIARALHECEPHVHPAMAPSRPRIEPD